MSILDLSATELARRIRCGEVSARDAVDAYIAEIRRRNPHINAVVEDRFVRARAEADAADSAPAAQRDRPFHGVPCTIKECFALEGMPQSSGLVARAHVRATRDAPAVARLRNAGAIPLGVTNVSELCMWMEANNRVYGRTNNPYDRRRTAGGSSGGEAAIVGAGASPFGLGSDIGGSIRMPAFFCGVFGHKPSSGLVPNTGQYPDAENEAQRYLSTGPIARRAGDLRPLVEVLAGHPLPTGERAEMTDIDVHVVATDAGGSPGGRPHRDVMRAVGLSAAALESRGARVRGLDAPYLRDALDIWAAAMHAAADTPFREMLADGTEISIPREILACLRGRSDHTLPALGLALIEDVPVRLMPKRTRRLLARLPEARHALTERLGPSGILLFPPYPTPAPRHGRALLPPTRWCGTAVFNVLELPVTQVPTGLGADGLPVGVQVAAAHGNDHLTISVAETLEAELGGWVPPPARRVHEPGGPPHETRSNGR